MLFDVTEAILNDIQAIIKVVDSEFGMDIDAVVDVGLKTDFGDKAISMTLRS
jgi:hypothetical protein